MGDPLVSPYAERYGDVYRLAPSALAANARRLLGLSLYHTAFYSFALAAPLGALGVWAERRRRDVLLVFLAVLGALVVGHVPVSEDSGMYFGERFYSEGYFALALAAGRGLAAILARLEPRRGAAALALAVLALGQGVHLSVFCWRAHHRLDVPARVRAAVLADRTPDAAVFYPAVLHRDLGGRWVNGRDLNDNAADWRRAPRFYMVDPGPDERARVARALGKHRWVLYRYEPAGGGVVAERGAP
jgi:hypothetical protein